MDAECRRGARNAKHRRGGVGCVGPSPLVERMAGEIPEKVEAVELEPTLAAVGDPRVEMPACLGMAAILDGARDEPVEDPSRVVVQPRVPGADLALLERFTALSYGESRLGKDGNLGVVELFGQRERAPAPGKVLLIAGCTGTQKGEVQIRRGELSTRLRRDVYERPERSRCRERIASS